MEFGGQSSSNKEWSEIWGWPREEYYCHRDSQNDFSRFLWNEVNQTELLCMLDEQTPVKDCADLVYQSSNVGGDANKLSEGCKESLQLKRRRVLRFTCDPSETNFASDQMNASFFKSKMDFSVTEVATSEDSQWNGEWSFSFQDDSCAITCEELDRPSDAWLDFFNEDAIRCSSSEMKSEVVINRQADISECYDNSLEMETDVVQETPLPAPPPRESKGKQAHRMSQRKLNTSVVYPFELIKPCGVHGDVTLNDINQRIQAPPLSSLKHKKDEDPSLSFSTSALSGKPVVVKTKIHTEGQGSITITRTKG